MVVAFLAMVAGSNPANLARLSVVIPVLPFERLETRVVEAEEQCSRWGGLANLPHPATVPFDFVELGPGLM